MATAPRLPGYRGTETAKGGGRLPASSINALARDPVTRSISVAAADQMLPIVYGRANVPGLLFAQGMIGTDLVVGYALCVGEIDAIEMVQINDANASGISGVTVTTYLGTSTQTADATLTSAIAGFNDSMRFDVGNGLRGIAYIVLRITTAAAVGGWPRVRATIRGRKVLDPRVPTTAYSNNTALCMADLISNTDYGLGLTALNVADVADWCDSLLADGSTPRSRISLVLDRPAPILPDWLDLFAVYAECYYTHEGASIKLVRDSVVTLGSTPLETGWIRGTLSVRYDDTSDAPRSVSVIYTVPRSDALPWGTTTATRALSGGAVQPTTVRLDGVINLAEADNKALARLNRMQTRATVSVEVPDIGLQYQVGGVIRLDSPARGIDELPMRILSTSMSGPGRYRLDGELYDASHYPSETPPVAGAQLPAGAIILWDGGATPANFTDYTAANGKLIVGAGGTYAQGATGGTGWSVTFSGSTTTDGAHTGGTTPFYDQAYVPGGNGGSQLGAAYGSIGNPAHSHTYNSGAVTVAPKKRAQKLIKSTIAVTNVPVGGKLFGVAGIVGSGWTRDTANAGRVLEAAASNANSGSDSQNVAVTTGSASDSHSHILGYASPTNSEFATQDLYGALTAGDGHTHAITIAITAALKRRKLALYGNSSDAQLLPGHIVAWEGGAAPTDWKLCDGTSGTPDCRDYFIEISATGGEGTSAGNNTVAASGTTNSKGHQHKGGARESDHAAPRNAGHSNTVYHNHTVSASQSIAPPYYALAFIQYSPGV